MQHIAVLYKKYVDMIAAGTKTVESRFHARNRAPYNCVSTGDTVLIKESGGGPIRGQFTVGRVWRFGPGESRHLVDGFGASIGDKEYVAANKQKRYITLMEIKDFCPCEPYMPRIQRYDSWVVLPRNSKV